MITFTVPGRPVPAVRMTQRSKYKDPAAQRYLAYKEQVGWAAKAVMKNNPPLSGEISCTMRFYIKGQQPDLSNLVKAIEDGCNGIAWEDDRQVVKLSAELEQVRHESEQRAEVEVWEV